MIFAWILFWGYSQLELVLNFKIKIQMSLLIISSLDILLDINIVMIFT